MKIFDNFLSIIFNAVKMSFSLNDKIFEKKNRNRVLASKLNNSMKYVRIMIILLMLLESIMDKCVYLTNVF